MRIATGQPVPTRGWSRPSSVELEKGGSLVFRFEPPLKTVRPTADMLDRFIQLADTSDQKILRYARSWGSLKPALDILTQELKVDLKITRAMRELETVDDWRATAKSLGKTLDAAAELVRLRNRVNMAPGAVRRAESLEKQIAQRVNVGLFVNVRPQLGWKDGVAVIQMHLEGLSGALALQTMLVVARKEGLALCDSCGRLFPTEGKRRVYCADCGRKEAVAAASRKLYRIRKQAFELLDRGVSAAKIADLVGRPAQRIHRWRQVWESERSKNGK